MDSTRITKNIKSTDDSFIIDNTFKKIAHFIWLKSAILEFILSNVIFSSS